MARSAYSRAGSVPPISSTIKSLPSRISSKLPRLRVSTPASSGRRPTSASIALARPSSSSWKADPTVPCPRRPTRKGSAIAGREVLVGLSADDDAGFAVLAEDDRRPRDRVVVVGHGVAVGAGGRNHQDVPGPRVVEVDVAHEDVPRLAVLPCDRAQGPAAEAVG